MEVLKAKAKLENLDLFLDFIKQFNKKNNISEAISTELILVAEEIIVNVMNYAYQDDIDTGEVEIKLSFQNDRLEFTVIDYGQPFDITTTADPDVTLSVEEREVGGVGIFLVKHIMDEISYKRDNDRNILNLIKFI